MQRAASLTLLFLFLFTRGISQKDSVLIKPRTKKIILGVSTTFATVGSLAGLNQAWYSQYNTGRFHFFDDNKEWLQMDKVGHTYTTYQTARLMMKCFDWAGYSEKRKLFIGGTIGFAYMTAIEVMDGFSRGWGYSWGDQLADIVGASSAIAQEAQWHEQRIQIKFSFARSGLAQYNPSLLGKNKYSEIIKDYNGQTYWLSINPAAFMGKETRFPKWLNLALGYSAYGMLGGHYNRITAQNPDGTVFKIERERRYYLSLDVDLNKIPIKSKFLKSIFSVVNILKFPAPALQFSNYHFRLYGIYY